MVDDFFVVETNITRYKAMLTHDIDDKNRLLVERLLAEAEEVLAILKHNSSQSIGTTVN